MVDKEYLYTGYMPTCGHEYSSPIPHRRIIIYGDYQVTARHKNIIF